MTLTNDAFIHMQKYFRAQPSVQFLSLTVTSIAYTLNYYSTVISIRMQQARPSNMPFSMNIL